MENVHPDHEFRFKDGKTAKNIWDLHNRLLAISDEEYNSHVNAEKNDFAVWVEHAVKDQQLADKLRNASNKDAAAQAVKTKIAQLKVELGKSHVVSDFDLIKDFLLGLIIGLVIGALFGYFII